MQVKKQLTKKYGQDFAAAAVRNVDGCVNERVMQKLSVQVRVRPYSTNTKAYTFPFSDAHVLFEATQCVFGRQLYERDRQAV